MSTSTVKSCFVIAPIGEPDSATRRRSDQILKHVIAPAVAAHGYGPAIRADHIAAPGIITTQVIQQVVQADLVIADLSESNPNVYYELALRHAVRRPLVQLIEYDTPIPFDVAASRIIRINHHDLDDAARARDELAQQIAAVQATPELADNPVSIALDLQVLRESNDPVKKSLAELANEVAAMSADIRDIRRDTAMWDRLKIWDQLQMQIHALRAASERTMYDNDDLMSKLEDIERELEKDE